MNPSLPTLILRHKKENLRKCSLRGLETRTDCRFFTYPKDTLPDLTHYVLLTPDAPCLTEQDQHLGILLVDGTWRYAETMLKCIPSTCERRSLPLYYKTAYPRRQEISTGLASVEALYIALHLTHKSTEGLLDFYHWKEDFLKLNSGLQSGC